MGEVLNGARSQSHGLKYLQKSFQRLYEGEIQSSAPAHTSGHQTDDCEVTRSVIKVGSERNIRTFEYQMQSDKFSVAYQQKNSAIFFFFAYALELPQPTSLPALAA